jgi:hypothetical protein
MQIQEESEFMPASRTWAYALIYVLALGIIFGLGVLVTVLLDLIPLSIFDVRPFQFIRQHLYWVVGLAACALAVILVWNRIDKSTDKNYWFVYSNDLYKQTKWLVYRQGFHIGNIFESLVMKIKLFKVTDKTPNDKPRHVTAKNDVMRMWSTLTVRPASPRFLLLGEDETQRIAAAMEHAWTATDSLVEEYTSDKNSETLLGKANDITEYVQKKLPDHPMMIEHGLEVIYGIRDINESEKAAIARARLKSSTMMKETIANIASDPDKFRDEKGNYIHGAITEEEAAAIMLADEGQGSFNRDVRETIIRVVGDPAVLESLKGTGLLVGTIGAETQAHQHGEGDQ